MNEGAPKMETPDADVEEVMLILKTGGLEIDLDATNKFIALINNSDKEVQIKFNQLLIAYDEAVGEEQKKAAAVNLVEAMKSYL